MSESTIEQRLEAVHQLIRLFRPERIAYMIVAIVSVGLLLYCAVLIIEREPSPSALMGIFGSGGLISLGMGRMLTMWTQAIQLVAGSRLGR